MCQRAVPRVLTRSSHFDASNSRQTCSRQAESGSPDRGCAYQARCPTDQLFAGIIQAGEPHKSPTCRCRAEWWAHLVGASRVDPHKHAPTIPKKRSRNCESCASDFELSTRRFRRYSRAPSRTRAARRSQRTRLDRALTPYRIEASALVAATEKRPAASADELASRACLYRLSSSDMLVQVSVRDRKVIGHTLYTDDIDVELTPVRGNRVVREVCRLYPNLYPLSVVCHERFTQTWISVSEGYGQDLPEDRR